MRKDKRDFKSLLSGFSDEIRLMSWKQFARIAFNLVLASGMVGIAAKWIYYIDHATIFGDNVIHLSVTFPWYGVLFDSLFLIFCALYFLYFASRKA